METEEERKLRCELQHEAELKAAYEAVREAMASYKEPSLAGQVVSGTRGFFRHVWYSIRQSAARFAVAYLGWEFGKAWLFFKL